MFKNLSKILFLLMLWLGTFIAISANSWFSMWMGLEINLLSFIPMMSNNNNLNNSEAMLNYFLIQAFASTMILFSIMIYMIFMNNMFFLFNMNLFMMMIMLTIMLKLGAAPFHFWFPNVMENINWTNNLILMTWQKFAPMMLLSYLSFNKMLYIFVIMCALVGSIGGLNQISLRKLLAFSSINHMSWMFVCLMFNENLWLIYFILYIFLNFAIIYIMKSLQIFYLNQMYSLFMNSSILKFSLLTSILSLGGLPPFLGFFPKWIVIQSLMFIKFNFLTLFLILMSLITLFYYLKICFATFMLNYNEFNWIYKNYYKNNNFSIMLYFNFLSLIGFFLLINLINFT